jgi:hypothetical protein
MNAPDPLFLAIAVLVGLAPGLLVIAGILVLIFRERYARWVRRSQDESNPEWLKRMHTPSETQWRAIPIIVGLGSIALGVAMAVAMWG